MKKFLLLLSLSICCSLFSPLYASHVMGADLTFQCLGPNQYLVTLTGYRDCQGIQLTGPLSISVSSAQCGVSTSLTLNQVGPAVDITPVCATIGSSCQGGSGIGIQKIEFQGILNLPAGCGSDWILSWQLCCRNAAITTLNNPGNDNLYIEAHLNNTLPTCDNSPTFTNNPVAVYCNGYPQFFNHGATDADGDSLYFYLMPSLDAAGTPEIYNSPYSGTNPIGTSTGTNINGFNGQLSFTPNQTQVAVMKVGVNEYRNGVLIGHIERDMELIVENCSNHPPTAGGINGSTNTATEYTYNTTACSNFCFTIQTADLDAPDSVYYNFLNHTMPGATITSSGGLKPLLTICWAPTQADVGSHTFVIALRDNACPYYGTSSQAYTVVVTGASDPPVSAGRDTTLCPGASTTLTATSAGSVTSYTWSDGTTTHSGATWTVSPTVTTIYTVTAVYANGCSLTDQVVVTKDVPPTVTAFPAVSTICSTSDTIQLTATVNPSTATVLWSPAPGLTCTTCLNPKASPTASTTYTVTTKDAAGCTATFPVTVNLAPPPPVQSCSVIYATTTGTGTGTQANPTSLAGAISMAACNNALIKLGIGIYTIDNPISNITSYTTIEGGFDPANNWVKTSTPGATTIHRSALNMESSTKYDKRIVAIYFNGNNYFRFQDVTIETADCPALATTDSSGYSNYVFHMTNCANYSFVRCQIKPGKPTDGRAGVTVAGSGGAATGGTAGAGGAQGNACSYCTPNNGAAGTAGGAASSGAAGGAKGNGATANGSNTAGCGANESNGSNGGAGTSGVAGTSAPATAPAAPATTTTFFLVAGQSASGTNGTAGGGGGGGGGASGGTNCTCSVSGSGAGGAGGAGGNGGLKGTGGYGGGGTFGVYLVGNGTGGTFTDCDIIGNVAGAGGAKGTGQPATAFGLGATGSTFGGSCSPQGKGGNGGNGGAGGAGGDGQPGAPGVTAEIVSNGTAPTYTTHGTATAITTGINNPAIFNLGAQTVITAANISCTNRNDTLASAASGSWTAGSGAAPASGTAASFITQYTTTGRKDIVYNTNTYTGFVNIAIDQSSFIPVIQSSAPVLHTDTFWVCKGSTANFNVQIASADTFQWNFGGATTPNTYYGSTYQNLTGLTFNTAGTFPITVRIKTSCCGWSPYDTVYLLVEPTSTISYTGPTSFCPGDSVHIILSGTASSYSWAPVAGVSNPAGSNVYISPAVTTTYLATAYSPRGLCNADTAITITKNLPPTLTFTSTPATCGSVGSATVTPSPAGSYTYVWSPGGGTGASISPEPAGTYSVTVTPQGTTCSVTGSTSISAAGGLQAYVLKTVSPKCFGQCTGLVKVEAIGGTAPFTYHWSNGPSTLDSIVNLCAGTYTVTITDANSCTATATQLLSQPQLLTVAILDSASPVCAGQCTGRAHGDGQGGTGPYTLVWSNGETGLYDTLLCVGHYTVALVDNNNCTASGAVNISSPPAMTVAFATVNDSCHGLCDGRLKATVTNGQSPYTYLWNNATTGPLDSNLCASTYTVTVTDSFSCTVTASSAISQPTALTASITGSINDSCFGLCDGRATVAAAGGTSGYTYVWANTTTGTIDSNLCQGNYTVTAKDALGCTATASIAITQPVVLSATITTTNVSCNGVCDGTATAVPAGGTAPYTYTWSNAATTVTAGSLCAGAYTVTVKDHNGCTAVANTAITQPTPLTISLVSSRNDSCNGQCNGQIVVLASGGTTAYTYTWSNAATGATANNLCTNSYTVTVKDAHLCSATLTQAITQPTVLTASITATTNVTCNGLCNGSTTAGATGGTAPYTYTWSNAATTPTISSLCAATYTVTVKDALGCTATATTTITQPVALTVAISTQVNVSCNAACDGSLTAAAVGGTGPYTYTWSDTHTGATDNNLCAATYTVTAQDANNCTATVSATITQPVVLTVAITSTRNDSCNGKCDGRVAVAAAGGTLPYTYTWADGTGGPVDSDLCAVPASVTVTDAHGCTATTGTTITQPTPLVLSLVSTTPPSCFGGSNGQIVVSATGGTPIYYYSVDFGPLQATGTFTGLSAGMHAVGVGDSHICIDTLHILLGQPALLVADTIATTEVSCNGGTNGTITVGVSGGTYPYHYVWPTSPSNTDSLGTGFAAGTYAVNVTDANGCTATTGATITQPTPLTGTAATDSVSCNGGSDGQVTITPAGGTPSYTYQLDGAGAFQPSDNFTGLAAGPHSVIIHDANSCSTTVNFTIYQPNVLTISITSTRDDSCNGLCDGRASALAAGGTQPYTYVWGDGTGGLVDSNLCAGAANVTVTDARNCTATISTNITQPTPLVLSLVSTTPPSCYGSTDATITVSASGGTAVYQYSFDGGTLQASGLFTGITGGTHVLGVTDAHLCTDTIHVNIVQPSQIVGDTISTHDITCYGGSDGAITLGVSGGTYPYTYTWPQSPTTTDSLAVNLIAGTYSAYITDARGCHDTVTTVITQPAQLTATFTTDSVSCNGNSDGKVFIAATGGVAPYGYQLDASGTYQAADSFTALAAGPHSVIVQDANGCTTTVNFTIYQPLPLTVALSNPTNVTCAGQCNGSVTSTPSGGTAPYTYLWCDGSSAPGNSNLCAGTCGVTVTDARGCTATISVTITQPQPLALTQTGATPPHCFDGNDATFAISATGGTGAYQFSADSGVTYQAGTTFTGRTPGSVPVQVKDANGCIDTLTVVIPNAPQNDTYTTSETDVSCNGGSDGTVTTTLASGTTTPYSYTWSYQNATTPNLANVPAGTYYVTITDANGCKVYGPDSTVVSQPQPITDVYTVTMPKCYGGSDGCVNVTPTGGTGPYTHSWSNGATTANPCVFAAGSYTDTITDAHGCVHIDNSIVVGQPQPVTETITATPVACPGDSSGTITVAGGGGTPGYTYSWAAPLSSSSATVSGLHTGTYTVTVTDANSCTTTASATVTAAIPLVLNAQKKNVLCPPLKNGAINLPLTGGTPPYSFVWDNGTTSPYQYGLAVGTYNVTITDANGCVTDTSFVVGNDSSFVLRVTPDTATINEGQTVQLAADVTGGVLASINWSPDYEISCTDCTTPQASPLATTQYLIHAVSDSGCVSDAQSIITVLIQHQIYVPNTFTPNNDGINDVWEIFGTKTAWKYVEVEIFDRWGEKVFESTDINFGWDGSFKGTMMEPNVYVYVLKVTFIDGYTASNKGTITIIR